MSATELPEWGGEPYDVFLSRLHRLLTPKTYFEIGTNTGTSLALASCRSIAVDPHFKLNVDVLGGKQACMMFGTTSDAFFASYSPLALFGQPVEMAFLDGQHLAEFLLRDFSNIEKFCRRNSVVLLHDCMPIDVHITGRDIKGTAL